ncbi:hypothetical protein PHISP_02596 [Aspergillus sp. HF37]|nr:hypothetical protein PHISP_02596 [Aspergillus sp. HF37]
MAAKHRLTVASMWSFEDVAIQEIQNNFKHANPEYDYTCDYSKADHVIRVNTNLEDHATSFASLVSDFIEEQKNKDLLDAPRISQLDIATVLNDEGELIEATPEKDPAQKLLVVDSDSDEDVVRHSLTQATKHWVSCDGGLGCFTKANREILWAISSVTGTTVTVSENMRSIKVSGRNTADVDDALAKLTRIEAPLSVPRNARTANMVIVPHDSNLRVRIENYANLNDAALARVLDDVTANSNIPLSETFTTVCLAFDPKSHTFKVPENLLSPRSISNGPGKSRIWNDFTFQEIGKGEDFINLESIVEKNMGVAAPGVSLPHPYLTADKAKQVNQWVSEGAGMEQSAPDTESIVRSQRDTDSVSKGDSSVASRPAPPSETKLSGSATKKPRGIKTRKPMRAVNTQSEDSVGSAAATSEAIKHPSPKTGENAPAPTRRVWDMVYAAQPSQPTATSQEDAASVPANGGSESQAETSALAVYPQTPEYKPRPSSSFDATKYGANKTPGSAGAAMNGNPRIQKPGEYQRAACKRRYGKQNDLVDVFAPVTNGQANCQPLLAFDQPALVPQNHLQSHKVSQTQSHRSEAAAMESHDLLGLELGCDRAAVISNGVDPESDSMAPNGGDSDKNEKRLMALKKSIENSNQLVTIPDEVTTHAGPSRHRPQGKRALLMDTLAQLERPHRGEGRQSTDESTTREFYRTMQHRAPMPGAKPMSKAEKKAVRQATLEDAWGIPKTRTMDPMAHLPEQSPLTAHKENLQSQKSGSKNEGTTPTPAANGDAQAEIHTNHNIKTLFKALKPNLDAAEYFQGALSLEVQIGLVLVPLRPRTYHGGMISLDEWTNIFRSKQGLLAPTTKFVNRVTTAGSDVDYIVDLQTSKPDLKRRLFEQEYTEYSVSYEYHCRTKADHEFVIAISDRGKHTIRQPTAQLGAVNLHMPKQIWDGRVVVSGTSEHVPGSDPELEEAVRYLIDNLWVQPDRPLIRIFTKLPKGNIFIVEKVLMKRWTRHRHIRPGDTSFKNNTADASSVSGSQHSSAASSKGKAPSADKDSVAAQSDGSESQDLFLQITEVQDLFIGICPSDSQAVRARAAGPSEMIRTGRQWCEVSLVSPAIEDILKSNSNIEIGERTEEWRSSDLLGNDIALLSSNNNAAAAAAASTSPVSSAIGAAGLGELLRLTQTVIEKLDGIGYWNNRPGLEPLPAPTLAPNPAATTVPAKPPSPEVETKAEHKSMDFDEIESVKEVGSVVAPASAPVSVAAATVPPPVPASVPAQAAKTASVAIASSHQRGPSAPDVEYW